MLVFLPGETLPMQHELEYTHGIGYAVRSHAQLKEVAHWSEVPIENKEVCYARFFVSTSCITKLCM